MKFDKVIMNPPYAIGGKIWDKARKFSKDIICLMPFSQYENKERYLFIKDILFFDTLKNSLFNACLSKNVAYFCHSVKVAQLVSVFIPKHR